MDSKATSVDSDDDELFIDVEEARRHPCYGGFGPLTGVGTGASNVTVLSLQAMVDAVVGRCSPSSSSVTSGVEGTASSPRCSPTLCRSQPPGSPGRKGSVCPHAPGRRPRLPDVVQQLPSGERHRQRRSFLIEEILRPDFGRRLSPSDRGQQLPAEVGGGANHVTAIWQPFADSPTRTLDDTACSQRTAQRGALSRTSEPCRTGAGGDRKKKSAKRKSSSQTADVGKTLNCGTDESATALQRIAEVQLSSRSSSSSSSSSSSASCSSGSGSDVSTESSTNVARTQSAAPPTKIGQLALPAWVYCTRYSDRPSSGI